MNGLYAELQTTQLEDRRSVNNDAEKLRATDVLLSELELLNLHEVQEIPKDLRMGLVLVAAKFGMRPHPECGVQEAVDFVFDLQDGLLGNSPIMTIELIILARLRALQDKGITLTWDRLRGECNRNFYILAMQRLERRKEIRVARMSMQVGGRRKQRRLVFLA